VGESERQKEGDEGRERNKEIETRRERYQEREEVQADRGVDETGREKN
jgi:hypothetical protein